MYHILVQFNLMKCTGGVAVSPGAYVTAGKDGKKALFLALFNIVIIKES